MPEPTTKSLIIIAQTVCSSYLH